MSDEANEILKDILSYPDNGLSSYQVEALKLDVVRHRIKTEEKFYISDNMMNEIRYKPNNVTISEHIEYLRMQIINKYGSFDTARFYQFANSLIGYGNGIYRNHEGNITYHDVNRIIQLLHYATSGKISEDRKYSNDWMDANEISNHIQSNTFKFANITVKLFKNQKVKLSGLTDEQQARIDSVFDVYDKFRR